MSSCVAQTTNTELGWPPRVHVRAGLAPGRRHRTRAIRPPDLPDGADRLELLKATRWLFSRRFDRFSVCRRRLALNLQQLDTL
jgi:hypothetical protein